jgi:pSer/pThr/pTyr-binding forkhead associated (FHA) protein
LKIGVNTVGRSSENDVVVRDAYISRRHCAILVHLHNGCELHDTASKNGTYLNGKRLDGPHRLQSGDEIRICERQFVFMTKEDPRVAAEHSPTMLEA